MRRTTIMRRYAVRLAAFTSAFIVGAVVGVVWQNPTADVGSTPRPAPPPSHSADAGKVCEVHGGRTARRYVSILAGAPGYPVDDADYLAARKRLFPNSNPFIIDRGRAKTEGHAEVDVCSECRAAERVWIEKH
jgi:hypothetical protein